MQEIENTFITLDDGRKLSARIWLPDMSEGTQVPAILEYLPYRKRDGTAPRDESTYPYFAAAGYGGVRVDISGTGESDGDFDDEYSPREHADALQVINWISHQPWCDGNIGMMGISWGGFNSLQVAALQPEALKAVIAIGTTVDRYNDDIHYKNGCQLYSNFSWSSVMLCFASRPPDPALRSEDWKAIWKNRLETQPFPLEIWGQHQRRDDYWRHGSVCEDYSAMDIPSLVISGWADGYINAPPAMATHRPHSSKAINGPWIHKYPHFAWPRPRMDFHAEAIQWWDRWLKGEDNGVAALPAYRAYLSKNIRPDQDRKFEEGCWVAEDKWPSDNVVHTSFYPDMQGQLVDQPDEEGEVEIQTPLNCGIACGEFFPLKPNSEMAGDQRHDDALSVTFDSAVLGEQVNILGRPRITVEIAINRPVGHLIARLNDVHPDGTSHRVSWGVINLTHRSGNENPSPMQPGQFEKIEFELDECGYSFVPGHKIRLALSTSYWPTIVPAPEMVTATLKLNADFRMELPVLKTLNEIQIAEPERQDLLPAYQIHQPEFHSRKVQYDLQNRITSYQVFDDTGEDEMPGHGLRTRHTHEEEWCIADNDPLSYSASSVYTCYMQRHDWRIKTVSESEMTCDQDNFYIRASVNAWLGDELFNSREWKKTIPRDHM